MKVRITLDVTMDADPCMDKDWSYLHLMLHIVQVLATMDVPDEHRLYIKEVKASHRNGDWASKVTER